MRNLIILVETLIIGALVVALGVSMSGNTRANLELRDLRIESDARNTDIARLNERIINVTSALTFIGRASWYGDREHGRPTSSGEIFDRNELTAAALWIFPKGTTWLVYRPDTGASVTVRINDIIPARHGRILDLSEAAARALGMIEPGVVTVQMKPAI